MNYYPYFNNMPYMATAPVAKTGIFKNLFGNLNLSSIINGTQKTLNIVNQTIPLIKQAGPVINNAKTMFRVMNEFKKVDINKVDTENIRNNNITINNSPNSTTNTTNSSKTPSYVNNGPTFFQ